MNQKDAQSLAIGLSNMRETAPMDFEAMKGDVSTLLAVLNGVTVNKITVDQVSKLSRITSPQIVSYLMSSMFVAGIDTRQIYQNLGAKNVSDVVVKDGGI